MNKHAEKIFKNFDKMDKNILCCEWIKTRNETPENENDNIVFITESHVFVSGWYSKGKFIDGSTGTLNRIDYDVSDVICWINEEDLKPKWLDEEQQYRTDNGLNH